MPAFSEITTLSKDKYNEYLLQEYTLSYLMSLVYARVRQHLAARDIIQIRHLCFKNMDGHRLQALGA